MKNISIRMEEKIISKINAIAKREDRDRSYIINKAVKEYLDHEEYILNQIQEGIKDIEDGKTYSFEAVQQDLEDYIESKK